MAIFDRVPRRELGTRFKFKGWFGLCPVYIDDWRSASPTLTERNWVPAWWFGASHWMQCLCMLCLELMDEFHEPHFAFRVTGTIEPR